MDEEPWLEWEAEDQLLLLLMRVDAKLDRVIELLESEMAKRKNLSPEDRARLAKELRELQAEIRALIARLQARRGERGSTG